MSTDDGRRMVAEALDALDPWELDDGEFYDCGEVECALGLETDDGSWYRADGVRRLAGLVAPAPERTCRNVGGEDWGFKCSECGGRSHGAPYHVPDEERGELARLLCGRIVSLHGSVPRYCPNCGARVVGQA